MVILHTLTALLEERGATWVFNRADRVHTVRHLWLLIFFCDRGFISYQGPDDFEM